MSFFFLLCILDHNLYHVHAPILYIQNTSIPYDTLQIDQFIERKRWKSHKKLKEEIAKAVNKQWTEEEKAENDVSAHIKGKAIY